MNGLPPVFMNNEANNANTANTANTGNYLKDLNKTLVNRNIKSYIGLVVGCFALLLVAVVCIPLIAGNKDNGIAAQANGIMKFAKVENSTKGNNNVGVLAGSEDMATNSNAKKIGDGFGENTDESRYVEIDLSQADAPILESEPANVSDTASVSNSYTAYVDYQSNVRSEPAKDGAVLSDKQRGDEVTIVGEEGEWYKIIWGDDGYAYINKSCIVEEKPQ